MSRKLYILRMTNIVVMKDECQCAVCKARMLWYKCTLLCPHCDWEVIYELSHTECISCYYKHELAKRKAEREISERFYRTVANCGVTFEELAAALAACTNWARKPKEDTLEWILSNIPKLNS